MGSIQELEQRVTAVEKEQKEVRTLAAGASQDVSDYKAALQGHTSSLNALRETQLEQAADLKRLSSAVEKQSSTLEKQSSTLEKQSSTLEKVLAELQTMREERFQQSVDFRALQETQTRHYGEYHRAFAVINARLGYAIEALERPGGESGRHES